MERRLLLYLFLLGTLPISAQPFSVGAPAQACADLRPQHGGATQSTPSPFELDMEVFQDVEVANVPITHSYMPSRVYSRKTTF